MGHAPVSAELATNMISVTRMDTHFSDTEIFKNIPAAYMQSLQSAMDSTLLGRGTEALLFRMKWFQKCCLTANRQTCDSQREDDGQ